MIGTAPGQTWREVSINSPGSPACRSILRTPEAERLQGFFVYRDYEGAWLSLHERERIFADFGPEARVTILRNHGGQPGGYAECERLEWPALLRKLERERGAAYRA